MKLGDITLADCIKAGWSAKDVKELLGTFTEETQTTQSDTEQTQTTQSDTEQTQTTQSGTNDTDDTDTAQDALRAELEQTKADLIKAKESLAKAQLDNSRADFSNKQDLSPESIFENFLKDY